MREILFRGRQSGGSGEWIDGGIWIEDNKYYIVGKVRYFPDTRDWNTLEYYEDNPVYRYGKILVDPETVCQYTGFKDKNGNKIFEGDIVNCYAGVENRSVVFDENMGAFEFDNNDPVDNPDGFCLCADHDHCEIIGNVHDNPELLKGE